MQAIELVAHINPEHELHLKLPENTETGSARVIILFEGGKTPGRRGNLDDFLEALPINQDSGIGHDEIMRRIDEERACWGDS